MEVLLLGIYAFFVWLVFIKFKWLPWNITSQVIVITLPIVGLTILILCLNIIAPPSHDIRVILRMADSLAVLHEGEIHAFVLAKVPEVGTGVGALMAGLEIQPAAALVDGVGIMVADALATQIIKFALDFAGNFLGYSGKWLTLV